MSPPARWGTSDWLESQFGDEASEVSIELTSYQFVYPSPQHFVDFFRTYYSPVERAFANLDGDAQDALEADILALVDEFSVGENGTMRVPSEYAQVVITKA